MFLNMKRPFAADSGARAPVMPTRPPAQRQTGEAQLSSRFAHYLMRPILRIGPLLFAITVAGILVLAWLERDEGFLTAESGVGYWLGIAGAIIMLSLVGYPLRKRIKAWRSFGRVANWFRLHMILGIVGPALIVLHTNFNIGSLNSRLALFTMLIVVASGIAGRYLYAKVHKGLYGSQADLRDVLADVMTLKTGLGHAFSGDAVIAAELERYAPKRDSAARPVAASFISALLTGARTRSSRRRVLTEARRYLANASNATWRQKRAYLAEVDSHLKIYFAAVKKAERLALFERLFGLWHHLHMPLFVLLAITVTLHIIAVHLY